ncbi:MAG TPA: hypothetical protein VHF89_05930 [Solirubrobacteraceae bacterium]|nr:hypothetical protein [Solirubrobacteraceae bacterium]
MSRPGVLALLSASLALAACGSQYTGPEKEVEDAIKDLQQAAERDEAGTICNELLAKAVVDRIRGAQGDCEDAIQKALDRTDSFRLTVESIRIVDRTNARARVETGTEEENVELMLLVREGDRWKVSALPGAA